MSRDRGVLSIWQEKLEFLRREQAIASDAAMRFQLMKEIEEIENRINELEGEMASKGEPSPTPGGITSSEFDIFLSHNSKDKALVRELNVELKERGVRTWLDEEQLVPGRPWQDALEVIIKIAKTAAVIVGPSGLGPWEIPEMRACLTQFVERELPVIPILLPGTPAKPRLPLFLRAFTWVDLTSGITAAGIDRIIWGVTGSRTGDESPPLPTPAITDDRKEGVKPSRVTKIFKTVGLPDYTYVEPDTYEDVVFSIEMPGKHLLLQGPSGSGKTCMIRRILGELRLGEGRDYAWLSALEEDCPERLSALLERAIIGEYSGIIVVDDLHLLDIALRDDLSKKLKYLSDTAFNSEEVATFILIGIPTTAETILMHASDLGPRIEIRRMPTASSEQLRTLISEGGRRLGVEFLNVEQMIEEASESFCLCQNVCLATCRVNGIRETQTSMTPVAFEQDEIRRHLVDQLTPRFLPMLSTFCSHGHSHGDSLNPFLLVIRLLSKVDKQVVRLAEIVTMAGVLGPKINSSRHAIAGALRCSGGDGILQRMLHYDDRAEVFSIEDPMFGYFLRHVEMRELGNSLGYYD